MDTSDEPVQIPDRKRSGRLAETVGTHVRRIYAKLGAGDRSAAIHRARELRLLSAGRAAVYGGRSMSQLFQSPFGPHSTASEGIDGGGLTGHPATGTRAGP